MSILVWNDNLSVNIQEIDDQHKNLVKMINELNTAMLHGKTKQVLGEIIHGLINYAGTHFATEEKYFHQFHYPDTEIHKRQHNEFVKKVTKFKQDFDQNRILLSIDIMKFLQEWLINHIKGSDKKYGPFLIEKGLK